MENLTNNILKKITAGELKMRPRWHFALRAGLFFSALVTTALIAMYLLSFIFFALAHNGLLLTPAFGLPGVVFFVTRSPWLLILSVGVFLTLLYFLVQHFAFSYRRPLLYSFLAVVAFVLVTSSVLHILSVQQHFKEFSERHHVPGLTPLYRDVANTRPDGITPGEITNFTNDGFRIETPEHTTMHVIVSDTTRGTSRHAFKVGDRVLIFGVQNDGTINAQGVRPLPPDGLLPPPPRH